MKALKLFFLTLATVGLLFAQTSVAKADPLGLFFMVAGIGGWAAVTYEECKEQGIDAEDCAKKTWAERQPLDYSEMND